MRNKPLIITLSLCTSLALLSGCVSPEQQKLNAAYADLTLNDVDLENVTASFALPVVDGEVVITWDLPVSSPYATITHDEAWVTIVRPSFGEEPVTLELVATLALSELTKTKEFSLTIIPLESLEVPLFTIDTYYDTLINPADYSTNKYPFMIYPTLPSVEIAVNGEVITDISQGFYQVGEYEITAINTLNDETYERTIKILPLVADESHEYNIFLTQSSMPTMVAAILMLGMPERQTFISTGIFDAWANRAVLNAMPNLAHLTDYFMSVKYNEETGLSELWDRDLLMAAAWVKTQLLSDPDAHFNLYVMEDQLSFEYALLARFGLDSHRYQVKLISDGTGTYNIDVNAIWLSSMSQLVDNTQARQDLLKSARLGAYVNVNDYDWIHQDNPANYSPLKGHFLPAIQESNVVHFLQHPLGIILPDPQISEIYHAGANVIQFSIPDLSMQLPQDAKDKLNVLYNIDYGTYNADYFNKNNGKRYVAVLGTSMVEPAQTYEQNATRIDTFFAYFDQVIENYAAEYNILFKPHPRYDPFHTDHINNNPFPDRERNFYQEVRDYLNDNAVASMPGPTNIELILAAFPDLAVGGYNSTSFLTARGENVLFFFAPDAAALGTPIGTLADQGAFPEAVYITL